MRSREREEEGMQVEVVKEDKTHPFEDCGAL